MRIMFGITKDELITLDHACRVAIKDTKASVTEANWPFTSLKKLEEMKARLDVEMVEIFRDRLPPA